MSSYMEDARAQFNRKNPKDKISRVSSSRARVAPKSIKITLKNINFTFWVQPFPSNCGVISISGITPHITSEKNLALVLQYIDIFAFYYSASGIIYTTTNRQSNLSEGLSKAGYGKSRISFNNRNSGNRIFTYIRAVPSL